MKVRISQYGIVLKLNLSGLKGKVIVDCERALFTQELPFLRA